MKNFDIVRENILSIWVDVVRYEGEYFAVVRNSLVNNTPTKPSREVVKNPDDTYTVIHHKLEEEEIFNIQSPHAPNQILNASIDELLDYDPEKALTKIGYIRRVVDELTAFKIDTNYPGDAFLKFLEICRENRIDYYGPLTIDLKKLKITQNFVDDLNEEVAIRLDIIIDIEIALQKAFNGAKHSPKPLVWFDEARYNRALDNNLLPGELKTLEWEKINNSQSVSNQDKRSAIMSENVEAVDNDLVDTDNSDKTEGELPYDFKNEVLNEKGRLIFDDLISDYSGKQPQTLVFMMWALSELGFVNFGVKTINKVQPNKAKWFRTFSHYFHKKGKKNYIERSISNAITRTDELHTGYGIRIRKEVSHINDCYNRAKKKPS